MPSFPRSAPAVLIATAALFLCFSGGAVASHLITGKQIKNNTVTTQDIKDGTLRPDDLAGDTITALSGSTGKPGTNGTNGTNGSNGADGADGLVRGFAKVASDGTVTQQSGGITTSSPSTGIICVTVPGVSPTTSVAVVSLNFSNDGTNATTQAYAESNAGGCAASEFGVRTFVRDAGTGARTDTNQPFIILVP